MTLRAHYASLVFLLAISVVAVPARAGPEGAVLAQARTETSPDLSVPKVAPRVPIKTVAVLLISSEEGGFALSEIYSNARKALETNTALTVAPLDVISLDERAQAVRECAGKGACFAERVRGNASANVQMLLTVSVDRLDEGFLLGLRLVDVETAKEIGAEGDEVPAGMSLLGAMERQLPNVFPPEIWGQVASLTVESEPTNSEVTVGGRPCVSPCSLSRLPTGNYDVTVRKQGYLAWNQPVVLTAKQDARITAKLSEEKSDSITSSWIFWAAIGAVVVGGATAAVLVSQRGDDLVTLCISNQECD